jgi:hypothetical protein
MFLTDTVRTGNFDNLQPWRIYALAEPVTSTAGRTYAAGTEFWFEYAIVTRKTRDALVHGSTPEGERIVIATSDNSHRRIFADKGSEWRPPVAAAQPSPAPPTPAPVQPHRAQMPEARWFAAQPQFARASAIIAGNDSEPSWGSARQDADVLRAAANALQHIQPDVAIWLAHWSLVLYHSWMAQATSGGEGTAMMNEIRNELAEMRRLEAK